MTTHETNRNQKKHGNFINFSDTKRNQWNNYRRYGN